MPSGYHHLTYPERCPIYALRKSGYSIRAIARELNRSHTTIARELRRNSGHRGYRHVQAERTARERRRASTRPWKLTAALWVVIEGRLRRAWSPEQIAGRLRREGVVSVRPEWIYQHIRDDRRTGGDLWRSLRRRGKKPNVTAGRDSGRGCIPNRVDSAARPARVEAKTRVGDWEADTGDGQGAQWGSGDVQGAGGGPDVKAGVDPTRDTQDGGGGGGCDPDDADARSGTHHHGGPRVKMRQGVCPSCGDCDRSGGPVLLCASVCILGTGPERAHEWIDPGLLSQGYRFPGGNTGGRAAGAGRVERASPQGSGISHPEGGDGRRRRLRDA